MTPSGSALATVWLVRMRMVTLVMLRVRMTMSTAVMMATTMTMADLLEYDDAAHVCCSERIMHDKAEEERVRKRMMRTGRRTRQNNSDGAPMGCPWTFVSSAPAT